MAGPSFPHRGAIAWRFAANVFVGSTLVWVVLREIGAQNPIWAIAAMIASVDPQVDVAARMFGSRIVNVLVGAMIGLAFMLVGGSSEWTLPMALAATVLVSSYLVRVQTMWRQAPITAAIVVAGSLQHHDKLVALHSGAVRVGEVLLGCLVGIGSAWLLSRLWPLHEPPSGDKG